MENKKIVFENNKCRVIQVTTKKGRYYEVNKGNITNKLYSVTTIIGQLDKPALVYWSAKITAEYLTEKLEDIKTGKLTLTKDNIPQIIKEARYHFNEIKKEAGDIGSKVHNLIELYLKKQEYKELLKDSDERVKQAFNAFLDWVKKYKFEVVETEQPIWDIKYCYAGTLDTIGYITIKGKKYLVLIDFKTSNQIFDTHIMQIASYKKAWEKKSNKKLDKVGVLRLDKETGIPELVLYNNKDVNIAFKKFILLLKYYYLNKGIKI